MPRGVLAVLALIGVAGIAVCASAAAAEPSAPRVLTSAQQRPAQQLTVQRPVAERLPPVEPAGDPGVVQASFSELSSLSATPPAAPSSLQPPGMLSGKGEVAAVEQTRYEAGDTAAGLGGGGHLRLAPDTLQDDQSTLQRIEALERQVQAEGQSYPVVGVGGFFQLDESFVNQSANNVAIFGDVYGGVSFRRVRLQALGNVTEHTRFDIEVDFVALGRPSLMDVWGEEADLPFFGNVRIGHFRQPTTMDALTSVRHLEFLERSAPFWSFDPFRRTGIMAYRVAEDEMSVLAYSMYATGYTFFNGVNTSYATLGDTRFASEIGDSGGVSFAIRGTHLLWYYDEGAHLFHIGGGYNFSQIGGEGTSGPFAKTYEAKTIPEFFQGDLAGGGLTAAGTPAVLDTGRIVSNSFNFYHTELAGNFGPFNFQTEFMAVGLNQLNGPQVFYYGNYFQCGYFLTGEHAGYSRVVGVLDYNVDPFNPFYGSGPCGGVCGWGAWEVAFRWSYVNLNNSKVDPANQLSDSPGPPPAPNPGQLNESTVAVNWWWNRNTRAQFNWIHSMINNTGRGPSTMNTFAARFQVEF